MSETSLDIICPSNYTIFTIAPLQCVSFSVWTVGLTLHQSFYTGSAKKLRQIFIVIRSSSVWQ